MATQTSTHKMISSISLRLHSVRLIFQAVLTLNLKPGGQFIKQLAGRGAAEAWGIVTWRVWVKATGGLAG